MNPTLGCPSSQFWPRPFFGLALVAGVCLAAGCGKQPAVVTAGAPPAPAPEAVAGGQPVLNPPATPAAIAPDADGGVDLKQLNHAYIGWIVQSRHRPKTYEEFVATSGIQVPAAPAGKKFVIDGNGFIALVNRSIHPLK
jgi:hypothetical protein